MPWFCIIEFGIKRPDRFVFAKFQNIKQLILQLINKKLSGLISLKIAF